ncbi:MAG: cell division protein FtsZ [Bacteroidales bacterium]|nr:cell division protein FtsZ [Bacteroidales bacterium]
MSEEIVSNFGGKTMTEEITSNYGEARKKTIIKVIGIGGAGNNAVQHMYKEGIVGVDFLVCNTDRNAVENNAVPMKLVFGESGLGAGANPKEAERLANESEDKIKEMIGNDTKLLFITAGMGKGTGTGASPVVARIAREMGILTIAVVTYPYELEGTKSFDKADKGIAELKKYVDSLIIVQNQKMLDEYENETLRVALGYADDVLKNAVKCIAELITLDGYQNVDFHDVETITKDSGDAMLGLAEASGEDRIEKVVAGALTCPLIDDANVDYAQNFLFFVRYGEGRELTVAELKKLSKEFDKFRRADTNVIWGHAADKDLGDKIRLSVIITNYTHKEETPATEIAWKSEPNNSPSIDSLFDQPAVIQTPAPAPAPIPAPAPANVTTSPATPNANTVVFEPNPSIQVTEPNANIDTQPSNSNPQNFSQQQPVLQASPAPTIDDIFNFSQPQQNPVTQPSQPIFEQPTQPALVQPAQPNFGEPIQPSAPKVPEFAFENGTAIGQIQILDDGIEEKYEDQQKFDDFLKRPAFDRLQENAPKAQQQRMEQMVTPAKVVPQPSYSKNMFFSVIPSVD